MPSATRPPGRRPRSDVEAVLATAPRPQALDQVLGTSREGRQVRGTVRGTGPLHLSLIGGCHADEPVGPEMLRRLATYLASLPPDAQALAEAKWFIVPHVNPDGEAANAAWNRATVALQDHRQEADEGYDLGAYLDGVLRDLPGDDLEWSFPLDEKDRDTRPEALAVADFLRPGAPFRLHASFHSMGFAAGPWFLLEAEWVNRTEGLRSALGAAVAAMGYGIHDVDRGGEKGFTRIAEGFSTRPDSRAMAHYFIDRGDAATASLFRPSSMEFVRSLGGDPLTLVSEMPLFLLPEEMPELPDAPPLPTGTEGRNAFLAWAHHIKATAGAEGLRAAAERFGIRPMPLKDQMRLQLAFLNEGLVAAALEP